MNKRHQQEDWATSGLPTQQTSLLLYCENYHTQLDVCVKRVTGSTWTPGSKPQGSWMSKPCPGNLVQPQASITPRCRPVHPCVEPVGMPDAASLDRFSNKAGEVS